MASDVDAIRAAIESEVSSVWETRTEIQWANRHFTNTAFPWLRLTVLFGDSFPLTMSSVAGGALNIITGVVECDLFARQGEGIGTIVSYADEARMMLTQLEVSGVQFGVPTGPAPVNSNLPIAQLSVRVPFEYTEAV